jgi:hypothetical protein
MMSVLHASVTGRGFDVLKQHGTLVARQAAEGENLAFSR